MSRLNVSYNCHHRLFAPPGLRHQFMSTSKDAVADTFREYNARMLPQLPAELWVETWKHLDVCHRVHVSHTCAHWRSIALASTDLWCNVDIHIPLSVECCPDHVGQSCMPGSLGTILQRSGVTSIFVTIREDNYVEDYLDEEAVRLLSLLQPHIARIASLRLFFRRPKLLGEIMRASSVWPSLRTLNTVCLDELEDVVDCNHDVLSVSFPKTVLPRLENLYLASDHRIMRETARCIPSTLLRLKTDVNSISKLLEMLNRRNNLRKLDLMVWQTDNDDSHLLQGESEEDRESARQQLIGVPCVSICACDDDAVARMLEVFDNGHRQELDISCTEVSSIALCAPLFRPLQGQVRVVLITDTNHHVLGVKVTDARGVVRTCSYATKGRISSSQAKSILIGLRIIWEMIHSWVAHLQLSAGAWMTVIAELGSISTLTARSIILTCSTPLDLSLVPMEHHHIGVFTSLETLEIWIENAAPPERIIFVQAVHSIARAADIELDKWNEAGPPRRHDGYTRWAVNLVPQRQVQVDDSKL